MSDGGWRPFGPSREALVERLAGGVGRLNGVFRVRVPVVPRWLVLGSRGRRGRVGNTPLGGEWSSAVRLSRGSMSRGPSRGMRRLQTSPKACAVSCGPGALDTRQGAVGELGVKTVCLAWEPCGSMPYRGQTVWNQNKRYLLIGGHSSVPSTIPSWARRFSVSGRWACGSGRPLPRREDVGCSPCRSRFGPSAQPAPQGPTGTLAGRVVVEVITP